MHCMMVPRAFAAAAALAAVVLAADPSDAVFKPGTPTYDANGTRMYAGGANLFFDDGVYYMVGEGKKVHKDCSECINMYKTQDLREWTFVGCVLKNEDILAPPPFQSEPFYRMERPKIFKCPGSTSSSYRMVFHCDTDSFEMRSIGVLSADKVEGPYTFLSPCFKPDGLDSYDMGTFVDTAGDGKAYLVRSVENRFAGISEFNEDCTNVTGLTSSGPKMEGQAIMRDVDGTLHLAGSHLTGWAPNAAQFVNTSQKTLTNATWSDNYNPSASSTTYDTQSTFIFPFKHTDGHTTFLWMADRWNANGPGGLDNMTQVWLPLVPPANAASNWTLPWLDQWSLKDY